jgi:hypothetical protein
VCVTVIVAFPEPFTCIRTLGVAPMLLVVTVDPSGNEIRAGLSLVQIVVPGAFTPAMRYAWLLTFNQFGPGLDVMLT